MKLKLFSFASLSNGSHAENLADIKEREATQVKLKNRQPKVLEAHKWHKYCKAPHAESSLQRRGTLIPSVLCKGTKTNR